MSMKNKITNKEISLKREWFNNARFGMFIHWGLYSILGRGEWVMFLEDIPINEYALLANQFNPPKDFIQKWANLAKGAGMKYIVLTTRHHDGFSLFDSKASDFTSVKTRAKRDFVAEYVSACRKAGMKIGFYYSLIDWRWPAAYQGPDRNPKAWKEMVEYAHTQVEELCTQYGKIDILWYDGSFYFDNWKICSTTADDWQSKRLNAMVRKYQPHILINDRSRLPEDFDTPEQHIAPSKSGRFWESCMTINDSWGYSAGDHNWKSTCQIIHNLVTCATFGGNLLLNIGPKYNGEVPRISENHLREVGIWMKTNGESVYGTGVSPFWGSFGQVTIKEDKMYLHVFRWPGKELCIGWINRKVKTALLLIGMKNLKVVQKWKRVFIKGLPEKSPDPYDTVIMLKMEDVLEK